ncbi:hypothetical protein AVEN_174920-1 [Araneus ventricosus]|uniref:Uncharacterized protein n=1 Tax=Araneus ventricosus TaxID=182803 RepID=A0A4Y2MFI7_ARAVE|nr:hypothetical protein AVEN_174920-1 [Araneus ventricosus]
MPDELSWDPPPDSKLNFFLIVLSRSRPGGRGGKTKGLQKKKIRPTKRYDSSSDSTDYYDPPLVDSDDDINLDINDGDKPDSRKATCIFCDGSSLKTLAGKCGLNVLCAKCWHT